MTKDDMEIELAIRTALANEVGHERFNLWFAGGVELRVRDGRVSVAAPDAFRAERLRSVFRAPLARAVLTALGGEPAVEFVVDESLRANENAVCESRPATLEAPADRREAGRPAPFPPRRPSLEQFVVGPARRMAYAAARRILERPRQTSPLFVFGPAGSGKTHLLDGICLESRSNGPYQRVLFLSAEQFTSHFLEALQGRGLPSFRAKCRNVDLLVIDDVQFFAGKRATLVELQHTIDSLVRDRRQLVLAADRAPGDLKLGPELTARMSAGLVCALEMPDTATRRAILEQVARDRDLGVPDTVLDLLAGALTGDVRQLHGALNQLEATAAAHEEPISRALAERILAQNFHAAQRPVQLVQIERAVCDVFGLEPDSLQSSRRAKTVSHPRMLAMWLARRYTRAAFAEIGSYFGRRSHSTVISAHNKVDQWLANGERIPLANGNCEVNELLRRVETRLRLSG